MFPISGLVAVVVLLLLIVSFGDSLSELPGIAELVPPG